MNNDFPRMVYKAGGNEEIHDGKFSTHIAHDAGELDAALAGGWFLTTTEATKADTRETGDADNSPPTRDELETKARELGIEFSPRLGDAKLAERIEAALAPKA